MNKLNLKEKYSNAKVYIGYICSDKIKGVNVYGETIEECLERMGNLLIQVAPEHELKLSVIKHGDEMCYNRIQSDAGYNCISILAGDFVADVYGVMRAE